MCYFNGTITENNTASIEKMADAQRCVLRQYTIQVNKLIYFDNIS